MAMTELGGDGKEHNLGQRGDGSYRVLMGLMPRQMKTAGSDGQWWHDKKVYDGEEVAAMEACGSAER